MDDNSSIDIHIPVPWSRTPARISARGIKAVVIAAVTAALIMLIALRR